MNSNESINQTMETGIVVPSKYPKAGFFRRGVAAFIDNCIAMMIGATPIIGMVVGGGADPDNMSAMEWTVVVLGMLVATVYLALKDGMKNGQSIGKRMMDLMVVKLATNQPCTKGSSALRWVLYIIPYVGNFLPIVDIIMILANENGQKCGDKLAKTQVISVSDYCE